MDQVKTFTASTAEEAEREANEWLKKKLPISTKVVQITATYRLASTVRSGLFSESTIGPLYTIMVHYRTI
jgi:hypothetical protein